jgi:hypothetical protein
MGKQTTTTRDVPPPSPLETGDALWELPDPNDRRWTGGQLLALCVLGILGFASSFSYIWDFDIFWHLACGEWMFRHHEVMRHDYFCLDADPNGWIDVHWFFQMIVTAIYKLGGWWLLSVFKGVTAAAILMTFIASLRRHVPTAWLIGVGILMLFVMQTRIRTRPEIFTLGLLLLSFALIDSVRRGAHPIRLWWMVPIMIFWVNIHGLFFLGLAIIWGSLLGAAIDWAMERFEPGIRRWCLWLALAAVFGLFVGMVFQKLGEPLGGTPSKFLPNETQFEQWVNHWRGWGFGGLGGAVFATLGFIRRDRGLGGNLLKTSVLLPLVAVTLACLISPWPIDTLRLPLLLSTRLSDPTYVTGVTELHRTYEYFQSHRDATLLTLLTACAMLANFRNLPIAHIGIFVVFVVMGLLARRNVGMLGPVMGFLLALHGGSALKELGDWKPILRRAGPVFSFLLASGAIALSSLYMVGMVQHYQGNGTPGAGLQRDNFNIDAGKLLADLDVEGDLMCENFGDAGVFDYYFNHDRDVPRRLLYMDGRLEAHSLEKFNKMKQYRYALSSSSTAGTVEFPASIRFLEVRFDSESELPAVMNARYELPRAGGGAKRYANRFRLICIDQAGTVFERMDWNQGLPGIHDNAQVPEEPDFSQFDLPLGRDNLLQDQVHPRQSWHHQNPPALNFQFASLLLNLGKQPFSVDPNSADHVRQRCIVLAIRHFHAALAEELGNSNQALALLAQAYAQRAWQQYCDPSPILPIDIDSACALRRFPQIRLSYFDTATQKRLWYFDEATRTHYCQQWVDAMVHAGMLDHTQAVTKELFSLAGVNPTDNYGAKLQRLRDLAAKQKVYQMPLLERASKLATRFGLIDEAIAQLKATKDKDPKLQLLLGDLLLRQGVMETVPVVRNGKPDRETRLAARSAYSHVELPADQAWQLSLRLALCDWVDGKFWPAADALKDLAEKTDQPVVKFYRLHLAEELGDSATIKSYAHDADLREFTLEAKGLR